jgi:hypothetical protein
MVELQENVTREIDDETVKTGVESIYLPIPLAKNRSKYGWALR